MRRDIDDALRGWPSTPGPGELQAREIRGRDGRTVIQVRVELGILQLETEDRPDGARPHGFATYLDYLRHRSTQRTLFVEGKSPHWTMGPEHCTEADREFVQFYHRRVAWLALQRYEKALGDAEHTIGLMDFVAQHGINQEYIESHERLRGLAIFHHAQAAAALALERRRPDEAIDGLHRGLLQLATHKERWEREHDDEIPDASLIEQLNVLEREIRTNFSVPKTLREQLVEAVESEDYERAARLRDQIRTRESSP